MFHTLMNIVYSISFAVLFLPPLERKLDSMIADFFNY